MRLAGLRRLWRAFKGRLRLWRAFKGRLRAVAPVPFDVRYPEVPLAPGYAVGLVVTTYDRPDYARRCLADLASSDLSGALVVVVDDASTSPETVRQVDEFVTRDAPVVRVFKREHRGFGVHDSLRIGWDLALGLARCENLANVDSDTSLKPLWLRTLRALHAAERPRLGRLIATGFNAVKHEVLSETPTYYRKRSIGGLNMFFEAALYRELVRPNLVWEADTQVGWDWHVVAAMRRKGYPFLCTRPSVIQHIGELGQFSGPRAGHDVATDYE